MSVGERVLKRKYENGFKYCSRCMRFYLTESVRCPECGTPLRTSAKKKSDRRKRFISVEVVE